MKEFQIQTRFSPGDEVVAMLILPHIVSQPKHPGVPMRQDERDPHSMFVWRRLYLPIKGTVYAVLPELYVGRQEPSQYDRYVIRTPIGLFEVTSDWLYESAIMAIASAQDGNRAILQPYASPIPGSSTETTPPTDGDATDGDKKDPEKDPDFDVK